MQYFSLKQIYTLVKRNKYQSHIRQKLRHQPPLSLKRFLVKTTLWYFMTNELCVFINERTEEASNDFMGGKVTE